jgi:hypothetical protein
MLTAHLADFERMKLFHDELNVPSILSPFISNAGMMVLLDAIADKRVDLAMGGITNERDDSYLGRRPKAGSKLKSMKARLDRTELT